MSSKKIQLEDVEVMLVKDKNDITIEITPLISWLGERNCEVIGYANIKLQEGRECLNK